MSYYVHMVSYYGPMVYGSSLGGVAVAVSFACSGGFFHEKFLKVGSDGVQRAP